MYLRHKENPPCFSKLARFPLYRDTRGGYSP